MSGKLRRDRTSCRADGFLLGREADVPYSGSFQTGKLCATVKHISENFHVTDVILIIVDKMEIYKEIRSENKDII